MSDVSEDGRTPPLAVTVQQTRVQVILPDAASAVYFSDVKLMRKNALDQWVTVAGPVDLNPGICPGGICGLAFPEDYDMMACEITQFRVTMDISSGTSPLGMQVSVDVLPSSFLILDIWNGPNTIHPDDISGGPLQGNPQEVIF